MVESFGRKTSGVLGVRLASPGAEVEEASSGRASRREEICALTCACIDFVLSIVELSISSSREVRGVGDLGVASRILEVGFRDRIEPPASDAISVGETPFDAVWRADGGISDSDAKARTRTGFLDVVIALRPGRVSERGVR